MTVWAAIAEQISAATGEPFAPTAPHTVGGGCINSTVRLSDGGQSWFVKVNSASLRDMFDAVGSRIEVWMDGGIRSGQDVLKAWALGARGTMIGRAVAYGLGAMGEAGVTKALEIIHNELDVTMAFCGHTRIIDVDRNILLPGTY